MSEQKNFNKKENWIKSKWRPGIAWAYVIIILFDFVIAPLSRYWYSIYMEMPLQEWVSLTLQNGGVFHISIGAILGTAAWTRGQEKIKRIEHGVQYSEDDMSMQEREALAQLDRELNQL